MSDATTPAAAAPAPQKVAKKAKKVKKASHPPYGEMIEQAIVKSKERRGISRQAIAKFISANYSVSVEDNLIKNQIRMALKRGLTSGKLIQSKGTGASGSFKVVSSNEKKPKVKKPATKKAPKAKKPKAPTRKSPKKPAKKVVKKTVAKAKSPKKVVKKVAKKPAKPAKKKVVRKAAAKKK